MVLVAEHAADTEQQDHFAEEAIGHLDTLYRGALRLTRDPARAEDLVQDTYVRALRYQSSYQVGTNMKAWLFAIMRNLFWDRFKGGRPEDVSLDGDRKSTRLNSSHVRISYAVFCLKKKKKR